MTSGHYSAKISGYFSAIAVLVIFFSGSAGAFTLSGTVTDIDTNAVPQVAIQIYFNGSPVGDLFDTTDGLGFYSITNIPSATYDISFTPDPIFNLQPRTIFDFTILGDTVLDVRLFPENHFYIEGIVTDTLGNGLDSIDLNVYDQIADTLIATTGDDTDSTGFYDVLVPAGFYRLVYRPVVGQPYVPAQFFNVEISGDTIIDVELEGGYYLQGTVTGPDGPVANADLDADDSFTGERIYTLNDNTDGSGHYQIVLPPGTFDINVTPQTGDRIVPGIVYGFVINSNSTLDFSLDAGFIFSGNVERTGGAGVPDVDLDVYESGSDIKLFTPGDNTDISGQFQLVLPTGTFDIDFEPPDSLRLSSVLLTDFPFNGDTSITVVLDTGMVVSGTVTDSIGGGVPHVSVRPFTNPGGLPVFAPGHTTDSTGFYDIIIPQDTYDIIYRPDSLLGILDSAVLTGVIVQSDTVINVTLPSAGPDTVSPVVSVISPNGGENWASYSSQSIVWSASDNVRVTSIDILLSLDGIGGPFSTVSSGENNDGTYIWNLPGDSTENGYIKIVARDGASNSSEDLSDGAFTIYSSPSDCNYIAGDVNNSGGTNGIDVIFMVNYFKGGDPPPYICQCTPGNGWFVAGDVNNSCSFNGLDVTYLVGYFKGGPAPAPCQDCPPTGAVSGSDHPGNPDR
jgi:hypothetical protein